MIFLLIYFCFPNDVIEFQKTKEDVIVEKMKTGKKFSDVVDVSQFVTHFPQAKRLVDIVDNLEFPSPSCYSEIIAKLNVDCNITDIHEQRYISLLFTKCFLDINNRNYNFPSDITRENTDSILKSMTNQDYVTFTYIKEHHRTLCNFAKQTMFSEETSKQLVNLFNSVVDSAKTIENINETMNSSFKSLTESVFSISDQLKKGKSVLITIQNQTINFEEYVKRLVDVMSKPFSYLENIKLFFLMVIITFFISFFLPEILLPTLLLTVIYFFCDKSLKNTFDWWTDSYLRIFMKILYLGVCSSYPIYKFSSNFVYVTSYILKLFRVQKEEVIKVPRFGYNQYKKPRKPRAY